MSESLRSADERDAYALWLWANDPATRAGSGDRGEISWSTHIGWVAARLHSSAALVYILESTERQPLGTIRFESPDGWRTARLSYGVASEARGHGRGAELIARGTELALARYPAVEIWADVEPTNGASRHLFEKLGWRRAESRTDSLKFVTTREVLG